MLAQILSVIRTASSGSSEREGLVLRRTERRRLFGRTFSPLRLIVPLNTASVMPTTAVQPRIIGQLIGRTGGGTGSV
jgi:hypothetical protein